MAESQDLKHLLLETNDEYRQLASKHHELDDRLQELISKHYLTDIEQFEEVTLKKRKLKLKDRMEEIVRAGTGTATVSPCRPEAGVSRA